MNFLNRFRIQSRIYGGFATLITLTLALGLFSSLHTANVRSQVNRFLNLADDTTLVLETSRHLETLQRAALSYAVQHDDSAVRQFEDARLRARDLMQEAAKDPVSPEYLPVYQDVLSRLEALGPKFQQLVAARSNADEVYRTLISPALTEMQARLDTARVTLTRDTRETQTTTKDQLSSASLLQFVVGAVLLALGTVLAILIARSIVKPLTQMTRAMVSLAAGELDTPLPASEGRHEIADMARAVHTFKANELARKQLEAEIASGAMSNTQQIAATAREQQASASEVAATVTEIGATSKEISATSRELLRTVGEVAQVAEQSATLAGNGQAGLTHMETTMRNVMEAAGAINAKLAVLNEKAGNINQVVVTITKVADQTNLLSLNAAIEAEKAGEYGRGFSVVATEIRRLADQTAVATYDIEQMVKEIQSAVAAGVMGMDKFSEEVRRGMHEVQQVGVQLSQIIQQVQTLAPRIETVNEGMQAQATGAEQITQALTQLNEATQQTVESLRQSAVAIDELNKVSSGLRNGITRASALKRQGQGGDGFEVGERALSASRFAAAFR